jgi:hypothetical protein
MSLAHAQEKHFLEHGRYTTSLSDVWEGHESLEGYYWVVLGPVTDSAFKVRVVAAPKGNLADSTDSLCMTLDESAQKSAYANSACTGTNVPDMCW